MDRRDELLAYAAPIMGEQLKSREPALRKLFLQQATQLTAELCDVLQDLIDQTVLLQADDVRGPVTTLELSFLRSAILSGTNYFRFALCDDNAYLDDFQRTAFWTPAFLLAYVEADMAQIEKRLQQAFIRLQPFELLQVRQEYLLALDTAVAGPFFASILPLAWEKTEHAALQTEGGLQVLFGGYIDQAVQLCRIDEGNKHDGIRNL